MCAQNRGMYVYVGKDKTERTGGSLVPGEEVSGQAYSKHYFNVPEVRAGNFLGFL